LRTLFVLVTIFGVWLGVQVKWIRDRHAATRAIFGEGSEQFGDTPAAPWPIRLLGEVGISSFGQAEAQAAGYSTERIRSLFPEATIQEERSRFEEEESPFGDK